MMILIQYTHYCQVYWLNKPLKIDDLIQNAIVLGVLVENHLKIDNLIQYALLPRVESENILRNDDLIQYTLLLGV